MFPFLTASNKKSRISSGAQQIRSFLYEIHEAEDNELRITICGAEVGDSDGPAN